MQRNNEEISFNEMIYYFYKNIKVFSILATCLFIIALFIYLFIYSQHYSGVQASVIYPSYEKIVDVTEKIIVSSPRLQGIKLDIKQQANKTIIFFMVKKKETESDLIKQAEKYLFYIYFYNSLNEYDEWFSSSYKKEAFSNVKTVAYDNLFFKNRSFQITYKVKMNEFIHFFEQTIMPSNNYLDSMEKFLKTIDDMTIRNIYVNLLNDYQVLVNQTKLSAVESHYKSQLSFKTIILLLILSAFFSFLFILTRDIYISYQNYIKNKSDVNE